MPRIVASLGVVITLAICIGFNTVRYPVVREMVAVSHQLPQVEPAAKPVETAAPAPVALESRPATSAATTRPRYVCTGDSCRLVSEEKPGVGALAVSSQQPAASHSGPSDQAASVSTDNVAASPASEGAPAPLVPVAPPSAESALVAAIPVAASPSQLVSADRVRRLPTVDVVSVDSASENSEPLKPGSLPIYPATITK